MTFYLLAPKTQRSDVDGFRWRSESLWGCLLSPENSTNCSSNPALRLGPRFPMVLYLFPRYVFPIRLSSQILLPSSSNPTPKHRTLNLIINVVKGIHNRLNPILIHLRKELFDRLFCLWACGIRSYRCAGAACGGRGRLRGGVEEEEFDICMDC